MLDLRIPADRAKFDALGPAKLPTKWLDLQGAPHFRVGSKEWIRRFGTESRFSPGQRVKSLVQSGALRLALGDVFTLLHPGEAINIGGPMSSGRYVWSRSEKPPYCTHLLAEHQIERLPPTAPYHDTMFNAIIAEARRRGVTAASMAKSSDIAINSCQKLLTGKARRPTWESVVCLALVAGIRVSLTDASGRQL